MCYIGLFIGNHHTSRASIMVALRVSVNVNVNVNVNRYDPSADLSDDIRTEDARVNFLKSVATIIAQKAHVKLSIKQLYKANG
jgi:glutamate formiminotransferase